MGKNPSTAANDLSDQEFKAGLQEALMNAFAVQLQESQERISAFASYILEESEKEAKEKFPCASQEQARKIRMFQKITPLLDDDPQRNRQRFQWVMRELLKRRKKQ